MSSRDETRGYPTYLGTLSSAPLPSMRATPPAHVANRRAQLHSTTPPADLHPTGVSRAQLPNLTVWQQPPAWNRCSVHASLFIRGRLRGTRHVDPTPHCQLQISCHRGGVCMQGEKKHSVGDGGEMLFHTRAELSPASLIKHKSRLVGVI